MSNEQTLSEGQQKQTIFIGSSRQGLLPFQLIFTPLPDEKSDEYSEQQWDWVEGSFTLHQCVLRPTD
jgi:hypothetical protein